ncbi:MAG: septum formation inhibitor Maf [Clostridiales bacterium]|nr:septum formation inhibitor Maf [Clostridiales bacterium]
MTRLILASGSPRRAEMMMRITSEFKIIVPNIDETINDSESPSEMVERLALEKAQVIIQKINGKFPVLAADTIVVHDRVLGKPTDEKDAYRMLQELADDSHYVITGVAIIHPGKSKSVSFIEKTEVFFGPISNSEIRTYIKGGEPMDKAGAYGIQGAGGCFITKINGCFYNVMGFPLNRIYTTLKELDII